jgi:hypothetical protein
MSDDSTSTTRGSKFNGLRGCSVCQRVDGLPEDYWWRGDPRATPDHLVQRLSTLVCHAANWNPSVFATCSSLAHSQSPISRLIGTGRSSTRERETTLNELRWRSLHGWMDEWKPRAVNAMRSPLMRYRSWMGNNENNGAMRWLLIELWRWACEVEIHFTVRL